MSTITLPRTDVTTDEVAEVLRQALGPRYTVLPGSARNWNPVGHPRPDHPDTIVVGTGSARLFRAQVTVTPGGGGTVLRVSPGGVGPVPRLTNTLWIGRKIRQALDVAPALR